MPSYPNPKGRHTPDSAASTRGERPDSGPGEIPPEVASGDDYPEPPRRLNPKYCADGFILFPICLTRVESMKATFGRELDLKMSEFMIYTHVANSREMIGKPVCMDSNEEIARQIGIDAGNVRKGIDRFVELGIFTVSFETFRGRAGRRAIWDNLAPRVSAEMRLSAGHQEPRLLRFPEDEEGESPPSVDARIGAQAPPSGAGAPIRASTGEMRSGAQAPPAGAGAPIRRTTSPGDATGQPIAQVECAGPHARMDREPPVPPTPVPGRQGAAGSAYVYVESSDSKNYVDVPPPDPGRRYRAERLINRLSSQNQYLWVSYEGPTEAEARDVIRHHMTSTGAEPISEGTAAEIRELRAEIIAELFRLDRVAPPRGLNVAGFPPTYRRPMAAPRPAEVPPKCATERLVVELAGCGDLGMVEPAARAMIEFTRDERAKQTGRYQAVSIKRHMKWMRLLVEGTVEAGVIVEAMDQARSATAMNPASCYFDRLEKVYPQFAPEGAKRGGRASRQSPTAAPGESQRHP